MLYNQPHGGPQQVDSTNPLTASLALLLNPTYPANVVNGREVTRYGTPTLVHERALGATLLVDGNQDAWAVPGSYRGTGTDITLFAYFRLANKGSSRVLLGTSNSTNAGVSIGFTTGTGRMVFTKGAVADISSTLTPDIDTPYLFAASYRHAGGQVLFYLRNLLTGVVQTASATHTNAWVAGDGVFFHGGRQQSPTSTWWGAVGLGGVYMRALSLTEIGQIASNPWQLFFDEDEEDDYARTGAAPSGHTLTASASALEIVGRTAALRLSRTTAAAPSAFAVQGTEIRLLAQRKLSAAVGASVLTGSAAALVYTQSSEDLVLVAAPSSFAASGQSAALTVSRRVTVAPAALTVAGSAATLTYAPAPSVVTPLIADSASFAVNGASALLTVARRLLAAPGTFAAIANEAGLAFSGAPAYARAPDGAGYAPRRNEYQARPASVATSRPAATQENNR